MATNPEILQSLKPSIFVKQLLSKVEKGAILFNRSNPNYYTAHEEQPGDCLIPNSRTTYWEYHLNHIPISGQDAVIMDIVKNGKIFLTLNSLALPDLTDLYEYVSDLGDSLFDPNYDEMIADLQKAKNGDQVVVVKPTRSGVIVGGTAIALQIRTSFSGDGGISLGGVALSELSYYPQGGASLDGEAIVTIDYVGRDGVVVGGSSMWSDPNAHEIASGGIVIGGSLVISSPIIHHEVMQGGVLVSGTPPKILQAFTFNPAPTANDSTPDPGWVGDFSNVAYDIDTPNTVDPLAFTFTSVPFVYDPSHRNFAIDFQMSVPPINSIIPLTSIIFGIKGTPTTPGDGSLTAIWFITGIDTNGDIQQLYYSSPVSTSKLRYTPSITAGGGTNHGVDGSVTSNITSFPFDGHDMAISVQCLITTPSSSANDWTVGAIQVEMSGNTYTDT